MSKKNTPLGVKAAVLQALLGTEDYKVVEQALSMATKKQQEAEDAGVSSKEADTTTSTQAEGAPVPPTNEIPKDKEDEEQEDATTEAEEPLLVDLTLAQFTELLNKVAAVLKPMPQPQALTTKEFNAGIAVVNTTFAAMLKQLDAMSDRLHELEVGKPTGPHIASESPSTVIKQAQVQGAGAAIDPLVSFWTTGQVNGNNNNGGH